MSGEKKVFKKRAFGGFDKDDVLNYIEAIAQKTKEEEDRLKTEIEEKEKENEELRSGNGQLSEQVAALEENVKEKETEIERLKTGAEDTAKKLSELDRRVQQYDKMKSDIAGIELAARRRAREIEEEGKKSLDMVRREAERLLTATKDRFSGFVENIGEQVSQAETALDTAKSGYQSLLSGLNGLKDKFCGLNGVVLPQEKECGSEETESRPETEETMETETRPETEKPMEMETAEETVKPEAAEEETNEFHLSETDEPPVKSKPDSLHGLMDRLKNK